MDMSNHRPGVTSLRVPPGHPMELLTIREAADYLRVCPKTVRTLINTRRLPATKVGRQYRISKRSLQSYLGLGKEG
jgi:excisionase family DNA binding protein